MKDQDQTAPRKRLHPWQRRRRKALLLALIFFTPLAVFFVFRMRLNVENDRALAALRAEGIPTTLEELSARYPEVSDSENAALLYLAAQNAKGKLLPAQEDLVPYTGHGPTFEPSAPIPEQTLDCMADYMTLNAGALSLLHLAAETNVCRYPIDFSKGMTMELPHLADLRDSSRMLCVEGAWAAETGDTARAARAVVDILCVAESLRKEPLLISQLVRIAIHGIARDSLARLLSRSSLPGEELSQIEATLKDAHDSDAFQRTLATEQCMGLAVFRDPRSTGSGHPAYGPASGFLQVLGLGETDLRYFLRAYRILLEGARKPFPESLGAGKKADEYVETLPRVCSIFTQMLVPSIGRAGTAFARDEAALCEMETALAIERYRQKENSLPDSLDALVPDFMPAVPSDPFDGASLRYRKGVAEYTIYSVYENRVDDGGMQPPAGKKRQQQPLDWAFRVVLPQ